MTKQSLNFTTPNEAWILHREEIETTQDGHCNIYFLLDAYSGFCFGKKMAQDLPSPKEITTLLKSAITQTGASPKQILIKKGDPFAAELHEICDAQGLPVQELPPKDLLPFVRALKDSLRQFKRGSSAPEVDPLSEVEQKELDAFIPDSYSPCPCASGQKFKFCCQKGFKEITFAMCAAEDGHLRDALLFLKDAEKKLGRTAEIVCREAICWSFSDMKKSLKFLEEAITINPKHPRTNYIMGIEAVADGKFKKAVSYYLTATQNYPVEDKFHLNETYNNLGTAYFSLKNYKAAKEVWEKALVLLPSDKMVRRNLFEYIYENPAVPEALREISPFIRKYLER